MDTSQKYIKMCKEATEIQKQWNPKEGDFIYPSGNRHYKKRHKWDIEIVRFSNMPQYGKMLAHEQITENTGAVITINQSEHVWLPRQDQLQEMLQETHMMTPVALIDFINFYLNAEWRCPEEDTCKQCVKEGMYWRKTFKTLEQVWLNYVMLELYNKIWSEEKQTWVKNG